MCNRCTLALLSSRLCDQARYQTTCYSLNVKCPPQTHTLNTWSPVDGTIWEGSRNFRRHGLDGGFEVTGVVPLLGPQSLPFSWPSVCQKIDCLTQHKYWYLPKLKRSWTEPSKIRNQYECFLPLNCFCWASGHSIMKHHVNKAERVLFLYEQSRKVL